MTLRCVLLVAGLAAPALQDNVGWRSFLQENTQEFQDLPLAWDGDTQVPAWLSGTYVRNGPAQVGGSIILFQINCYCCFRSVLEARGGF